MSKEAQVKQLTDYMAKFIAYTAKKLPDDVIAKLEELRDKEDSPLSKTIYNTMFENQKLAVELNRPSCQDTGVLQFWVKCGTKFPLIDELEGPLKEAVVQATFEAPLRHNSVETLMNITQVRMLVREHLQYSGIMFLTVTSAKSIHIWLAAAVHFQARLWYLCQVKVTRALLNSY